MLLVCLVGFVRMLPMLFVALVAGSISWIVLSIVIRTIALLAS